MVKKITILRCKCGIVHPERERKFSNHKFHCNCVIENKKKTKVYINKIILE